MNLMVKLREVRNILGIGFQDIGRFEDFDAVFVDIRNLILEEEGINAFVLVIRSYGNQQETERVHLLRLECAQQVEPAKREEFTIAFA